MATPDRAELLATVERSPQAVAAHDRASWVQVFAADGRIEDPVGSTPHVGHDQIYRFYDTFIGPRDITFHRDLDIVVGHTVLRDLELEVGMGPAVTMRIPAFLRYDLRKVGDQWQVARLRAYWELPAMMLQFLKSGTRALPPGVNLARGLLGNQGPLGTVGFMAGFRRVGARHKKLLENFLGALARGEQGVASRALAATATITLGDEEGIDLAQLVDQLRDAKWTKVIGAGPTVAVSIDTRRGRGILFADVAWRGDRINQIRYFAA